MRDATGLAGLGLDLPIPVELLIGLNYPSSSCRERKGSVTA